ncbi:MAG: efflux RND transporter periplasmic adaptor subunit [Gammaproteobacteria bacterium]|nr:MAG: efflux RND transporter periplasmic adaptor subunit [Gammaproteobacteria bacterium]
MIRRLVIVILVLGLGFGAIATVKYRQMQQMQEQMARPRPPVTVASATVTEERWRPALHAAGSLVAVQSVEVSTEIGGVVRSLHFRSGETVKRGSLIAQLDDEVDRAALRGLVAEQRLADIQLRRALELLPRKAISQSDLDTARARYDAARARVEEQRARIARKRIVAPFDGVLGIRKVDVGAYLSAGDGIVTLTTIDPIHVDYELPERDLPALAAGLEVRIRVGAWPGEEFTGRVTVIAPGLRQGTRTVRVRATLPNPDGRLRPGMFAAVTTLQPEAEAVLTVPRTAISYNTYGDFVFVIEGDTPDSLTVRRQLVEPGEVRDGRVAIRKGLEAGQRVVRAGLIKLRNGQPVRVDDSVELDDATLDTE